MSNLPKKSRVVCAVKEIELEGKFKTMASVEAVCSECDHRTESFGTGQASITRCLVLMREECPRGQADQHFYVESGQDWGRSDRSPRRARVGE